MEAGERKRGGCARAGIVTRGSTALPGFSQPLHEDRRGPGARRHINERLRCLACPTQIGSGRCSVARERGFIELGKKPLNQEGNGRKEGSKAGKGRHRRRGAGGLAGTRTQEEGRKEEGAADGKCCFGKKRWLSPFRLPSVHVRPSVHAGVPTYYLPTFPSHKSSARGQNRAEWEREGERKLGQCRACRSLSAHRSL